MTLSLMQALNEDRLEDFITQEEGRNVASISEADFDEAASIVIKTPLQDDQTSGLLPRDGLRGK
jgi:hypothetical protein